MLSVFLILLSCEKEVKIDIPGHQERLVIDGFIETGQPPFILLSKSKDIYATTDLSAFFDEISKKMLAIAEIFFSKTETS